MAGDATLDLARLYPFARALVNSGRLSVPAVLDGSALNSPDADAFASRMRPGSVAADAPVRHDGESGWLLNFTRSGAFTALYFGDAPHWLRDATADLPAPLTLLCIAADSQLGPAIGLTDTEGLAAQRYDARPGTLVLLRPDQHVCARGRTPTLSALRAVMRRALALS